MFTSAIRTTSSERRPTIRNKHTLAITGFIAALSLSVSTIGIHSSQAQDVKPTAVTITMNEYGFLIDAQAIGTPMTLKTGTAYILTIKNSGNMAHEIWFGRDTKIQNGRVDGYTTNLFTGVDMAVTIPTTTTANPLEMDTTAFYEVYLNPAEVVQLTFTLPTTAAGKWELGCFQPLPTPNATADSSAMTMPAATAAATSAATAAAAVVIPSHYDVGMKLPLIVQ